MLRGALVSTVFALALLLGGSVRAQEEETADELGEPTPTRVEMIALETRGHGVAPVVPRFVTDRLRARLSAAGYQVWDGPASHVAEQRAGLPYPPSVAALERGARIARVGRIAYSQVWAEQGRYVVQLVVVSIDGSEAVIGRVSADAENLGPAIDALVSQRVPPPSSFDREAAARSLAPAALHAFTPVSLVPTDRRPTHRGAIALIGGPGIGTGEARFYTFNLRARFELRFSRTFAASLVTGYANLPGGGQRVHNLPVLGQVEYKVAIADLERLRIPIRFAIGYIPFNGPIARASAGLNFAVNDVWEVGADLIAPTFLNSPSEPYLAFELTLEVVRRFGSLAPKHEP